MEKPRMAVCSNCGAEIAREAVKCPYCGYVSAKKVENKYLQELNDIKEDLEEAKKEPPKALKKGISKGVRVIVATVVTLIVLAAVYALILVVGLRNSPKIVRTPQEEAYASAYREVAGEKLAAAYEDRDIALMAQIYDKAYSEDRVDLWGDPHYETGYASSCYMKLQQCLADLNNGKLERKEAEEITYYCFYFYYEAYGEDGAQIFDVIREQEIIPVILTRLGFTLEDMENFKSKVWNSPYVDRAKVHSVTKGYYKNYH